MSWSELLAAIDALLTAPGADVLRVAVDVWMSHAVRESGGSVPTDVRGMFVRAAELATTREEKLMLLLAMHYVDNRDDIGAPLCEDELAELRCLSQN